MRFSAPTTMSAWSCEYRSRAKEPPRAVSYIVIFLLAAARPSCPAADTGERRAQGYLGEVACIRLNASQDNEMTHPHGAICALLPSLVVPISLDYIEVRRTLAICLGVSPIASLSNLTKAVQLTVRV